MAADNKNSKLKRWTFTFTQVFILLPLLAQTAFSEQKNQNSNRTKSIFKTIEALKVDLVLKEKNMREMLKNLSNFIQDEIGDTKFNINNVYDTIKATECYSDNKQQCACDANILYQKVDVDTFTTPNETINAESILNEFLPAIETKNFDKVARIIMQFKDENNIYAAVVETYKHLDEKGFNYLLHSGEKVTNTKRLFLLYNAMHNEMYRWQNDGYKYLQLIVNINSGIILKNNVDEITLQDAKRLLKVLRYKAEYCATDFLRTTYLYKNSTDTKTGNKLLNYLFHVDESLFEKVHQDFLTLLKPSSFYNETFNKLLALTKSRHNDEQEFLLHIINLYLIKQFDYFSENSFSELYTQYQQIQEDMRSKLDDTIIRKYSNKLKSVLPSSLYTMLTARKVCIRNVGLNEYLNTGGGNSKFYLHDINRRTPYTSAKCSHDGFGIWEIQNIKKDVYYLHSVDMNENMYASVETYVGDRHVVWLWVPGKEIDVHYEWIFELSGDNVYIKSDKFGEYLYGSGRNEESVSGWYKGHVYTLRNKSKDCPNNYCLWSFEDCTDV